MLFIKTFRVVFTVLLAAYSLTLQSQATVQITSPEVNSTKQKIEQVLASYTENKAFEGAILVAKSGQVVFEEAFGVANQSNQQPTKTTNSFQIASLSKPITATLTLILVQQKKLKLDNTLADYFAEFDNVVGKKITLHHLLSHTSGLPDHFEINGWTDLDFHKKTSEQQFLKIISTLPLKFEPGAEYLYSNPGYFLLGKIIEQVTGESYAANLEKHILSPVNMNKSGVADGFQLNTETVKGYQWKEDGGYRQQIAKNMALFGAGSAVYSTVKDLYQFDSALYSNQLLNKQNKARLFNPESAYSWRVGTVPVSDHKQVKVHLYDGQFDGYSSMLTRFVDDKHSIIILSNVGMSYFLKQQLTFDIAAVLYNQQADHRVNDVSLKLIKGLASGNYNQTLAKVQSNKDLFTFNEQSLSALAYQILWSGLGDKSLQLFSFIGRVFPESSTANRNLKRACEHRLTSNVKSRTDICS